MTAIMLQIINKIIKIQVSPASEHRLHAYLNNDLIKQRTPTSHVSIPKGTCIYINVGLWYVNDPLLLTTSSSSRWGHSYIKNSVVFDYATVLRELAYRLYLTTYYRITKYPFRLHFIYRI